MRLLISLLFLITTNSYCIVYFESPEAIKFVYDNLARTIDQNDLHMFKRTLEGLDQDNRQFFINGSPVFYRLFSGKEGRVTIPSLLVRALQKRFLDLATEIVTLRIANNAPLSKQEFYLIEKVGNDTLRRLANSSKEVAK